MKKSKLNRKCWQIRKRKDEKSVLKRKRKERGQFKNS